MSQSGSHGPTEEAHDVLAAEEFALPSPDPTIHHGPVRLPEDPTGIIEPHDVLAAEEFAMPAAPNRIVNAERRRSLTPVAWALGFGGTLVLLSLLRRRAL